MSTSTYSVCVQKVNLNFTTNTVLHCHIDMCMPVDNSRVYSELNAWLSMSSFFQELLGVGHPLLIFITSSSGHPSHIKRMLYMHSLRRHSHTCWIPSFPFFFLMNGCHPLWYGISPNGWVGGWLYKTLILCMNTNWCVLNIASFMLKHWGHSLFPHIII